MVTCFNGKDELKSWTYIAGYHDIGGERSVFATVLGTDGECSPTEATDDGGDRTEMRHGPDHCVFPHATRYVMCVKMQDA